MNVDTADIPCKCVVCDYTAADALAIFKHSQEKHDLDVMKVLSKNGAPEQLDYVKFVNYLRKNGYAKDKLTTEPWKDDQYLIPVMPDDAMLYFDVEESIEDAPRHIEGTKNGDLKSQLEATKAELLEARATIEQMKASVNNWLGEGQNDSRKPHVPSQERAFAQSADNVDMDDDSYDDEDYDSDEHRANGHHNNNNGASNRHQNNRPHHNNNNNNQRRNNGPVERIAPVDSSYFCSYSGYSVHKDMLQDTARTLAYLDFVKRNRNLFENKVVMDVGCGTGILSMFAVKYGGARKVFALEPSNMAFQAIETIAENGIDPEAITVINAPAESNETARVLQAFGEKVDIVISEWMGYFMIFENMLPSVIYARDKFMKPTGFIAPSKADLYLDATDSMEKYNEFVGFWSDVYGFTMSRMRKRILMDAQLGLFEKDDIVSEQSATILSMNLNNCPPPPANINVKFDMKFKKSTKLTAFVGWFTVDFQGGDNDVQLSTAPGETKTHWMQTALYVPEPVQVEAGQVYPVTCSVHRCENDHRSLGIIINFMDKTYRWSLARD
jgi:protein arginine N-methyltransferase 3